MRDSRELQDSEIKYITQACEEMSHSHLAHSQPDTSTSRTREKASRDGYIWRCKVVVDGLIAPLSEPLSLIFSRNRLLLLDCGISSV